jgi:hypothetical protein
MKDSQQEIKSTVTVNTSDMAAKAHEEGKDSKEMDKLSRKHGSGTRYSILLLVIISIYLLLLSFFFPSPLFDSNLVC